MPGSTKDSRGIPLPSYGIKEFVQLFGFGIAVALISMWTTQKVLSERIDTFSNRMDELSATISLQASSNQEYFRYVMDTYAKRHDAECAELKRKVELVLSGWYSRTYKNLGDQ